MQHASYIKKGTPDKILRIIIILMQLKIGRTCLLMAHIGCMEYYCSKFNTNLVLDVVNLLKVVAS